MNQITNLPPIQDYIFKLFYLRLQVYYLYKFYMGRFKEVMT